MVFSIEEARDYLSKVILSGIPGKDEILSLCNWMLEWKKTLSEGNKIVCSKRDFGKNIKFTYNYNNYPSFLVIKLPGTDIVDFPEELILDFYLTDAAVKNFKEFLQPRSHSSHQTRWVLRAKDISSIGMSKVQELFILAHQLRAR